MGRIQISLEEMHTTERVIHFPESNGEGRKRVSGSPLPRAEARGVSCCALTFSICVQTLTSTVKAVVVSYDWGQALRGPVFKNRGPIRYLVGNGCLRDRLILNGYSFFGFDGLMQAVTPSAALHGSASELINNNHLYTTESINKAVLPPSSSIKLS